MVKTTLFGFKFRMINNVISYTRSVVYLHNIQIGSYILNGQLLLYLGFGVAGVLMLRFRFRNLEEFETITAIAINGFLLWMIVWKASILLFHPVEVIHAPISLLYFHGGERGIWMAWLVTAIFVWIKAKKTHISLSKWIDILTLFLFSGWLVYQILFFAVNREPVWFHLASVFMSVVLLILLLYLSMRGSNVQKRMYYVVWYAIGQVLLWFGVSDRPTWIFAFSKQQLFFLFIALVLIGWYWLNEIRKRGGYHG